MVDWILGRNTNQHFRLKRWFHTPEFTTVESMAGATEELWFVNREFK